MSDNPVKDVVNELIPYFERLETESAAVMQLLTDKGLVSSEELNRYLEQAGRASEVKWRAARVRVERLAAPGSKSAESGAEADDHGSREKSADHSKETPENLAHDPSSGDPDHKQGQPHSQSSGNNRHEEEHAATPQAAHSAEKSRMQSNKSPDMQPDPQTGTGDRKKVDPEKSENAA
jgi:hypothetical protein